MKYIIVLLFVTIFILFDNSLGYTRNSPFYTHFTYMFQHAGIVHLIINSFAFIGVFRMTEQFVKSWKLSVLAVLSAFAASFFSIYTVPTVGASALIYSMLGIYIGITLTGKNIQITDKRKYTLFLVCMALGLLISCFRSNSNFAVHIWSLALGAGMGLVLSICGKE